MTTSRRKKTVAPPEKRPLTKRQAERLSAVSKLQVEAIADQTIFDIAEKYRFEIDPTLLLFRKVCGQVVKKDPATGKTFPVPFATVHVYDTDCNFWLYAPNGWPWVWLYPYGCHKEEIATVHTDECGNFCALIPRWDIDYVWRWRHERICFPDIFVKPRIDDLIPWLEIPRVKPKFKFPPDPEPDPIPFEQLKARLQRIGAHDAIQRIETLSLRMEAGEPAARMQAELKQPLFETSIRPPMPQTLPEAIDAKASIPALAEFTDSAGEETSALAFMDGLIGPFFRCHDIWLPEWTPITDVPDITFEVTQDVDNDGDEEPIYTEGFFDVRWESSNLNDPVILYASPIAQASIVCNAPQIQCTDVGILMAGLMPVTGTDGGLYHNKITGYALRPNKPIPSGLCSGAQSAPAAAPYHGTLQLYGCNHHPNAHYYRLLYSYNGGPWIPFTNHNWKVFYWDGSHSKTKFISPDGAGWYEILPANIDWYPHDLLLNWPTTAYPDGHYRVKMEFENNAKEVIHETQEVAFRVDNSRPTVGLQVEYRLGNDTTWHTLDAVCPVINRPNQEAVHFRVTASMSAHHAQSVRVWGSTCGAGGLSLANDAPDKWEVAGVGICHWHIDAADNVTIVKPEFTLAANASPGVYSFHIKAWERSFNPAGGDSGYENDWNYNPSQVWRQTEINIAVF